MKEYPTLEQFLKFCDERPDSMCYGNRTTVAVHAVATELRALLAERDALKPAPVERRLRAVKMDGYDDLYRWNNGKLEASVGNPRRWAVQHHIRTEWIDAVTALREQPYDPVETVEDIVRDVVRCGTMDFIDSYAARLRAAVAAEGVRDA